MNKLSFLDELMKLGGARAVIKTANETASQAPSGMGSDGSAPKADIVRPNEVATRLRTAAKSKGAITAGGLGGVTQSPEPIDGERFNRGYREGQT